MSDPKPSIVKALTPGYVGGSKIPNDEPVAKNFFTPDYNHNDVSTHNYGYPPVASGSGGSTGGSGSAAALGGGSHGSGCGCCTIS